MYKAAIITVSDKASQGKRRDTSGPALCESLCDAGFEVAFHTVIPDDLTMIADTLVELVDKMKVDLVLTTGGTGVGRRDVTPEATSLVIEKEIPGIAEAMRLASLQKTPHAILSRAIAGVRKETLIINLPGSPKGACENLAAIAAAIPHALDKIKGDPSECAK